MKTSTVIIFILLCIFLYACNFGNKASNESVNSLSLKNTIDINNSFEKRIVDPNTNSEKSTNLWIDLYTYAKHFIEKDSHGFIDMTIPKLILHVGGDSTMFNAVDSYFDSRDDYDYLSIKSEWEEGVFLTTENSIIAIVTQIREYGNKSINGLNSHSYSKEIMAESIDNGFSWKFADIGHLKHEGIENFYSKEDCDLIHKLLEQDKTGINLKINELVFQKN